MPSMTDPESPCIGVCKLNEDSFCVGCGRSIGEIAEWPRASRFRRRVLVEIAQRRLTALTESDKKDS